MQLTAQQASKLFAERSNLFADIYLEIDGEVVTISKKKPGTEITEETFIEYKDEYNPQTINLKTYTKNGTSWKLQSDIVIKDGAKGATSRKTTSAFSGFDEDEADYTAASEYTAPQATMIPQGAGNALLQYIATEKSKRADELQTRNTKLEIENERLKQKMLKLENDLALKDREHELVIQQKDNDSKNSLSGLVEQAAKPEIIGAIPGIIAALKGGMGNALPAAPDILDGAPDEATKETLTQMVNYLKTSPEMTAKVYAIVSKASQKQGLLDRIIKSIQ